MAIPKRAVLCPFQAPTNSHPVTVGNRRRRRLTRSESGVVG